MKKVWMRFIQELNTFLPRQYPKGAILPFFFQGKRSIKDAIESLGVPHTEVDLILVNAHIVALDYPLQEGDFVTVFPVLKNLPSFPFGPSPRFVADVHLGKLVRYLRILGFDTLYDNHFADPRIVELSLLERRIILTRDKGILKYKDVTQGIYLHSQNANDQVKEVLQRWNLFSFIRPFCLCLKCNGSLLILEGETLKARKEEIPPRVQENHQIFYYCSGCQKIYWEGTHFQRMKDWIGEITSAFSPLAF